MDLYRCLICGQVINKVLTFGIQEAKNIMIISDKHEEMLQELYSNVNRGATILQAKGGYTREQKPVIMMVVAKKQLSALNKVILQVDPEAFVIMSDVNEVHGEGFTYKEHL